MNPEKEIPEIDSHGYAKVIIQLSHCSICERLMVKITKKESRHLYHLFPYYVGANFKAQINRAGIVFRSDIKDKHDYYICDDCAKDGKSSFICALCDQERSSELKQESFGDPPEYLCSVCYETVPAKTWEEKTEELYDSHRWDFE